MPRSRPSSPTYGSWSVDDPATSRGRGARRRAALVRPRARHPRVAARARREPGDAARHPSRRSAPHRSAGAGAGGVAARPRRLRRHRRPARPRPPGGASLRVAAPDGRRAGRAVPPPSSPAWTPTTRSGGCRPACGCSRRSSWTPWLRRARLRLHPGAARRVDRPFDWFAELGCDPALRRTRLSAPALCLGSSTRSSAALAAARPDRRRARPDR